MQTPRTEFAQALRAIASERGLDPEVILEAVKQSIIAAYKRDAKDKGEDVESMGFDVELNPGNGEAKVFAWELSPEEIEKRLEEDPKYEDVKLVPPSDKKDVTPPGFGRIAAQIAKQVIHQKIREAEKGAIMDEFSGRVGSLISGMILRFEGNDVRIDLGRTEGLMLAEERVANERLSLNQRLTFLLKDIKDTPRGKLVLLSRADPEFVKKLFEREVPEIASGSVEIKGIAREAGVRCKIAVFSNQSGVDPVGSCVGQKGVRVQAVTNELGGERVDIVPFSDEISDYVKAALSPAEGIAVTLNKKSKTAKVKAPVDQLSLVIGRDGQNVRLASKLTDWRIEVEELPGEKSENSKEEGAQKSAEVSEKKGKSVEAEPESELEAVEKKDSKPADPHDDSTSPSGDLTPSSENADEKTTESVTAEKTPDEKVNKDAES